MRGLLLMILTILGGAMSAQPPSPGSIPLDRIVLPPGYHIELYATGVTNARAMDFSDDGAVLFAGSMTEGKVYAITRDGKVTVVADGMQMPTGLDFFEGDLFVSEVSRILRFPDILHNYAHEPRPDTLPLTLPSDPWHGWKFIRVGPDRKLYVPVGAPCNVCRSDKTIYASILRVNIDGGNLEIYAEGVRNTVGFDWEPGSNGVLWFTDNGRDEMGDDLPPDELNKAIVHGGHYGFPFIHGHTMDPVYWKQRPISASFISPARELPAHVAPLGMRFYTGKMFDEKYRGGIFIAEHGSWNRSKKAGYRVTFVPIEDGRVMGYEIFASGWMEDELAWGRPADVQVGPDGALYVSDDLAGCIYRIYYAP